MVVAFLDLLGFSWLMNNNIEAAYDNLNIFNRTIKTKISDNKLHPIDSYEDNIKGFVENTAVTSFENMISISDSLIIGASDANLFTRQISHLISTLWIENSESFRSEIDDILNVQRKKSYNTIRDGDNITFENKKTFPIFFRGGISAGENVIFNVENAVINGNLVSGVNVCGNDYVDAVKMEKSGKGPRLFCSKQFVDLLDDDCKKAIRKIDDNNYELVWTYYSCEATGYTIDDFQSNIKKRLDVLVLPAVMNLWKYYISNRTEKSDEYKHYDEFIKLTCRGICKYAYDNNCNVDSVIQYVNSKLDELSVFGWKMSRDEFMDFLI